MNILSYCEGKYSMEIWLVKNFPGSVISAQLSSEARPQLVASTKGPSSGCYNHCFSHQK